MHHIRTEDLIIIDIETASVSPSFQDLEEEWKILWQEKIRYSLPADSTAEEFYSKRAGVMAEFAKVVCISMGYFTKEPHIKMRVKSFYGFDEKEILQQFLKTVNKIESNNKKWCFCWLWYNDGCATYNWRWSIDWCWFCYHKKCTE